MEFVKRYMELRLLSCICGSTEQISNRLTQWATQSESDKWDEWK